MMIISMLVLIVCLGILAWYWHSKVRFMQLSVASACVDTFFANTNELMKNNELPKEIEQTLDAMAETLTGLANGRKYAPFILRAIRGRKPEKPSKKVKAIARAHREYFQKNTKAEQCFDQCVGAWLMVMLNDGSWASLLVIPVLRIDAFMKRHQEVARAVFDDLWPVMETENRKQAIS